MSNPAFTPSPWRWDSKDTDAKLIGPGKALVLWGSLGFDEDQNIRPQVMVNAANRRLIEAAPEMFEMIERELRFCPHRNPSMGCEGCMIRGDDDGCKLYNLVQKVKGEQPEEEEELFSSKLSMQEKIRLLIQCCPFAYGENCYCHYGSILVKDNECPRAQECKLYKSLQKAKGESKDDRRTDRQGGLDPGAPGQTNSFSE